MILVVLFCSALTGECQEDRFPLPGEVTPTQCFAKAEAAIAKRAELHEGETVARFGCARSRRLEAEARP